MRPHPHHRYLPLLALAAGSALGCATPEAGPGREIAQRIGAEAPSISTEIDVDQPFHRPGRMARPPVGAASDGSVTLAVWSHAKDFSNRGLAARVAADGEVLDPFGIPVPVPYPTVAFDGASFLVAGAGPAVEGGEEERIVGARVTADGDVLDPGGFLIADELGSPVRAAGAQGGSLVAWRAGDALRYARVTAEGAVAGGLATLPGADLVLHDDGFDLACGGEECLFVWNEGDAVLGARVDAQGAVIDPVEITIAPAGEQLIDPPVVAFDGQSFVAAWPMWGEVRAARVSPAGQVLDPGGVLVASPPFGFRLDAASDGASTVISWLDGTTLDQAISASRLGLDGAALDPSPELIADLADGVALTAAPGGYFAGWVDIDPPSGAPGIAGVRLDPAGALRDAPALSLHTEASAQRLPAAAFDGDAFLVAWSDDREAQSDGARLLLAARVTPEGELLDPEPLRVAEGIGPVTPLQAVALGAGTLVLWPWGTGQCSDEECISVVRGARVSRTGEVLDVTPLEIPVGGFGTNGFGAASNGAGALVARVAHDATEAALVSGGGAVQPVDLPLGGQGRGTAVASDGADYLVVWTAWQDGEEEDAVFGARVSGAGALLEPGAFRISPPGAAAGRASAAFDGDHYVVAWIEAGAPAAGDSRPFLLRAARVTSSGEVLDPGGITVVEDSLENPPPDGEWIGVDPPSMISGGQRTILAWRGQLTPGGPVGLHDLLGAAIDAGGAVSEQFVLSAAEDAEGAPALAAGAGVLLAAYDRYRVEAPYGAYRVVLRLAEYPLTGAPAPQPAPLRMAGGCGVGGALDARPLWLVAALGALLAAARRAGRRHRRPGPPRPHRVRADRDQPDRPGA
ncbi:MAG: hypothetical protein IT372_08570 [Polyangiaceae bacterium]|nr:hypothetical protein [Polyangiaceae bacterium]